MSDWNWRGWLIVVALVVVMLTPSFIASRIQGPSESAPSFIEGP
jgi:hypothetical protein